MAWTVCCSISFGMVFSEDPAFLKEFSNRQYHWLIRSSWSLEHLWTFCLAFNASSIAWCVTVMVSRTLKGHHIRIEEIDLQVFDFFTGAPEAAM